MFCVSGSLQGQVVDALGAAIVGGNPSVGEVFTTAYVEQHFGVSRSVAREAIRSLETLGLVRTSPKVGCTVLPASDWNVLAPQVIRWRMHGPEQARQLEMLIELRIGLEPAAARLAARRITWEKLEILTRTASIMADLGSRGNGDDPAFLEADVLFHSTVLEATANAAYQALTPTLIACLVSRNDVGLTPAEPSTDNLRRHIELASAIACHDEDAAETLAREIVAVVRDEVITPEAAAAGPGVGVPEARST